MRSRPLSLAIIIVIIAVFFVTNPSQEDFSNYLKNNTEKASGAIFGKLAGSVAGILASSYDRDNYYLFSIYYIKANGKKLNRHIGLLKSFVLIDK